MASSIRGTSGEDLAEIVDKVMFVLCKASHYDLEAEVVATAMVYLKENPDASIETALSVGLSDWDI